MISQGMKNGPSNFIATNRMKDFIKLKRETVRRRKSLVSTDTVCNNFVRQS